MAYVRGGRTVSGWRCMLRGRLSEPHGTPQSRLHCTGMARVGRHTRTFACLGRGEDIRGRGVGGWYGMGRVGEGGAHNNGGWDGGVMALGTFAGRGRWRSSQLAAMGAQLR